MKNGRYITVDDLTEFGIDMTDEQFIYKSMLKSEQLFDVLTRRYYRFNDFDSDLEWRKDVVKQAILSQIQYFIDKGATTIGELSNQPESISLGRTTINLNRSDSQANTTSTINMLVCDEMEMLLQGTGLLYRGVSC